MEFSHSEVRYKLKKHDNLSVGGVIAITKLRTEESGENFLIFYFFESAYVMYLSVSDRL